MISTTQQTQRQQQEHEHTDDSRKSHRQIRVSSEALDLFSIVGHLGETYDDTVKRVLRHYIECPEGYEKEEREILKQRTKKV